MSIRRFFQATPSYIVLIALGLFFLIPLLWPILASFNPAATLSLSLPRSPSLQNFITIISNGTVNNNSGGKINNNFTPITNTFGNFTNNGSVNNNGTIENNADSVITNNLGGTIENKGIISNSESINNEGTIDNYGTFSNTGTINNDGAINNKCGGIFVNTGTVNGNPVNFESCSTYSLELKQGANNIPNGSTANIDEEMIATAITNSSTAVQVNFTRTNPDTTTDTQIVPLVLGSAQYSFTPTQAGGYTIKADFGNGVVVEQTLNISFNVVPESMIGTVALIASSLGAFVAFKRMRNNNRDTRDRNGTDLAI